MNDRLLSSSVCTITLPSSSVALPPLWPRLHDYTLAFLGPGIVLLVGRVYQWVILLVLFHVLPHPAEKKNKRVKPVRQSRVMLKLQPGNMRYYSSAAYLRLWCNKRAIVIRSSGINSSLRDRLSLRRVALFYLFITYVSFYSQINRKLYIIYYFCA